MSQEIALRPPSADPSAGAARRSRGRCAAAVALCTLALAGCGKSPSEPSIDTLVFTGQLATDGRQIHPFVLPDFELVKIQLAKVRPILFDATGRSAQPVIGVGIGVPQADGTCPTTFSTSFLEGGSRSFGLTADDYCLAVFDPNSFPDDALVEYTVVIEPD